MPLEKLLDVVLDQDIDILKRTKESVDRDAFNQAADALVNARTVYVLGAGSSLALATFLAHYLRLIFDTVHLVEATSEDAILQQMVRAGEGDAILAISFPRYSKKAAKTLKYASDRGMVTIAITDSHLSPLAEHAQPPAAGPQRHGLLCGLPGGAPQRPQRPDRGGGHSQKDGGGPDAAADRGRSGTSTESTKR